MLAKTTEYAIRALVYIKLQNEQGNRPGVIEIAKEIEAPMHFTGKIMQSLSRQQLVDSMKGRGGGFFFSEINRHISLYDIIIVMEGIHFFERCGFGFKKCSEGKPCPLHHEYKAVRDAYLNLAKEASMEVLAQKIKNGEAFINTKSSL